MSGSDQLSLRYNLYRVTADNSRGAGALNATTASAGLDDVDHSFAIGNTWTLSPKTVNETRFQFAYGDLEAPTTDPIGPSVSIVGVASFGTLSGSPTRRLNHLYQLVDNLSHQAGAHALRAGVDFVFNDDTITFPRSVRGSYSFSSLANFLTGNYSGFTQTFGNPVVSQENPNMGIYAQDEWRVRPGLTLNLGLRYDLQFLDTMETDTNNVSPRVGVRVVAVRIAATGDPRQCRSLLRPGPPACGCERDLVGWELDRPERSASARRVGPDPDAGWCASIPEHSPGTDSDDHARRFHDDGPDMCRTRIQSRPAWRSSACSAAAVRSMWAIST